MYYHGESIAVNVHIQNNSNKTVKKIKAYIAQIADICLFTTASYTCEVAKVESTLVFHRTHLLSVLFFLVIASVIWHFLTQKTCEIIVFFGQIVTKCTLLKYIVCKSEIFVIFTL